MLVLQTNSLVGQFLHKLSLVQRSTSIQNMQTVPWSKHLIFFTIFKVRTSLCLKDQETQEKNVLGGPSPLWVSSYTSYLLYKVQDSAHADSPITNTFNLLHNFLVGTSLCFTDQETQEENMLGGPAPS